MFTPTEIEQILHLIHTTSERKAAQTLGVTHAVLQRAVPLPLSAQSEATIRAALQGQPIPTASVTNPAISKVLENKALLDNQLQFLREKEELLRQRDERRRLQREDEQRAREERRAEKKRRMRDIKYA